jgi:hypothetical protein
MTTELPPTFPLIDMVSKTFPAAAVSKRADEKLKSVGIIEVLSLLYFDIRMRRGK